MLALRRNWPKKNVLLAGGLFSYVIILNSKHGY